MSNKYRFTKENAQKLRHIISENKDVKDLFSKAIDVFENKQDVDNANYTFFEINEIAARSLDATDDFKTRETELMDALKRDINMLNDFNNDVYEIKSDFGKFAELIYESVTASTDPIDEADKLWRQTLELYRETFHSAD